MEPTKVLIVFCEGQHDIAFSHLVIEHSLKAVEITDKKKFSEYPYPFNNLFKNILDKHIGHNLNSENKQDNDLMLKMVHNFYLPDRTYIKNDWLILLLDRKGKNQKEKPQQFLCDFLDSFVEVSAFKDDAPTYISEVKFLFLIDADHDLPVDAIKKLREDYKTIEYKNAEGEKKSNDWITKEEFVNSKENSFAFSCTDDGAREIAAYVWCDPINKRGTLEDNLLPLFEENHSELTAKATEFVDCQHFEWKINHDVEKEKFAEIAKRKKAIITALGQRKKPGSSLNVILLQSKLLEKDALLCSEFVKNFTEFLSRFIGIKP